MSVTRSRPTPDATTNPAGRRSRLLAGATVAPVARLATFRHAVPAGRPIATGCAGCRTPIGLDRPLRPLSPTARCAGCAARVGAPPYAVELALLAGAALLLALGLAGRSGAELVAVGWWLLWAVPLTFVDLAVHRLPDRLTYPAAVGTWTLLGLAALVGGGSTAWLRATLGGVALAIFFAASTLLLGRRGFGLGDAKLALSIGALLGWFGWAVLVAGLLLAFLLSGVVSLGLLVTRRARWSSHIPFGPFLVLGTAAALALITV